MTIDPNHLSEDEQIQYVQQYWKNIRNLKEPSENVQLAAVEKYPWAILYCGQATDAVKLKAVKQDGFVIQFM